MSNKLKLPAGWKRKPIFDVAPIKGKLVDPKLDEYSKLVLIAPDHIQQKSGQIIAQRTATEQKAISGKFIVQKGEVIYSKIRPYLMKTAIAPEKCLCSADMYPLHCNDELEPRYLHSILLSDRFTYYANSCSTRTGIPKLNREDMGGYVVTFPPLPEQKAIADLLSTWDEAIEKTERLIQAKEKRFKWLLWELISKPRDTRKDTEWKKVKIGSFLSESRISGTNGRDAQKITVKLYGKGVISKDEKRIGSETTQYYVRKAGQFIYSKLDFLNGAFGIIPDELDGFESTLDLPAFDISDSVSKEWFLYYLIRPEYYTRQLGLAKGQRKARRVNPSEFLNSKIPLPSLNKQQQISETLSSAQHEIDLLKKLSEKYKTQKRVLMQKMLTGEWRVKPDVVKTFEETKS